MNSTTIINIFNSDNIAYIKTQHRQILAAIEYKILKFEPIIKRPTVINHALRTVITFSRINSFAYVNSFLIHHL